jgi:broad specificity phosphatase PhoE
MQDRHDGGIFRGAVESSESTYRGRDNMNRAIAWLAGATVALLAACSSMMPAEPNALVPELKQGGYVIVFRHGATNRDMADTDPLHPDNVSQQRLLSTSGREQARQVGEAFKKLSVPFGKVYTSQFNRAVETGKLIGGKDVIATPDVTEGGLVVTPIENDRRAAAFKALAAAKPEPGANTLIVSHKPNIIDAFGKDWFDVKEGEASVFKPDGTGKSALVARFQSADWIKAAR